jgi:hypothetical protein
MDKRQFRNILRTTAKEEIPVDMNRWNEIKAKIQAQTKPTPRLNRRSMRLIFVFVLLFIAVTGGYAYYQWWQPRGMDGVIDAGLMTNINQSQTIDDVTVTVKWAYADGVRAVVCAETVVDGSTNLYNPQDILFMARLYLWNAGIWINSSSELNINNNMCPLLFSFALPPDHTFPEQLNITFELIFPQRPRAASLLERVFGGHVVVSRGGGGGSTKTISPESTREVFPVPTEGIGVFTFNFNVSLLASVFVEPNKTISIAGIPITLESITLATSQTDVRMCIEASGYDDWQPQVALTVNEIHVPHPSFSSGGYRRRTERLCSDFRFDVFIREKSDTVTITVEGLENRLSMGQEGYNRVRERAVELGATINANGSYTIATEQQYVDLGEEE